MGEHLRVSQNVFNCSGGIIDSGLKTPQIMQKSDLKYKLYNYHLTAWIAYWNIQWRISSPLFSRLSLISFLSAMLWQNIVLTHLFPWKHFPACVSLNMKFKHTDIHCVSEIWNQDYTSLIYPCLLWGPFDLHVNHHLPHTHICVKDLICNTHQQTTEELNTEVFSTGLKNKQTWLRIPWIY